MIHIIYLTTCLINGVQYVGRHKVSNPVTLDPNYIGSERFSNELLRSTAKKTSNVKLFVK